MEETLKLILERLNSMDSGIKNLEKHVLIIENRQIEDSKALYDGYKQTYENTIELKKDIKEIKETLNVHNAKLLKVK